VFGIARRSKVAADGVTFWQGALQDPHILEKISSMCFDAVVITLTPDGRDASAYKRAYYDNVCCLLALWQKHTPPRLVVFVSSTRVYGQCDGEWVDESSATSIADVNAQILVDSENLLLASGINVAIIRFSGIYGPGRDYLLRMVSAGQIGGENYSNRIHIDDCVGTICHVLENAPQENCGEIFLASDSMPVSSRKVRTWLAAQMGIKLADVGPDLSVSEGSSLIKNNSPSFSRAGNKRCSNKKLLAAGYQFKYPSYITGYKDVVKKYLTS
jgi:nucleoside-diphosphate-sugar epimerase